MSQIQKLPDTHTDFIFSLRLEDIDRALLAIALVGVVAVVVAVLYVRRHGRRK